MTNEDKQLLLVDLCERLPYGVKTRVYGWDEEKGEIEVPLKIYSINTDGYVYFETNDYDVNYIPVEKCHLYIRPMSSMTDEEKKQYQSLCELHFDHDADDNTTYCYFDTAESFDWLNAHHFDYRGLIDKDLAISTEIFNPYKL